jgi:RNA polymerase sigma factor (sigma-70 family)
MNPRLAGFRELNEQQLRRLTDDELIEYIRDARAARERDAERLGVGVLVWGLRADVKRRVLIKVAPRDADDLTEEVLVSAIASVFSGETIGEFRAWLNTIVQRRIADHYRRHPPETEPLPEEHEGEEEVWRRKGFPTKPGPGPAVESLALIEQALAEFSEVHRRVVILRRLGGFSARETAAEVNNHFGARLDTPMTEDNVHQIASRFDKRLRAIIEGDGGQE